MTISKTSDQFLLDAYSGKGGFASGSYLVAHPRELDTKFTKRKELAVYPNFCRKITDVFVGYLWKQSPQRTGLSDTYTAFITNANGMGSHLDALLLTYQRLAMILGTVYVIVDKSTEKARSKADEKMPYLSVRLPSQLVYEEKDDRGEWVKLTFSEYVTTGTTQVMRYRTFTRDGWSVSSVLDGKGDASGTYKLGRVPVVKLHAAPPLDPYASRSDSFFYDLAQLNWDLYNLRSELRELFRAQTFAILALPVANDNERERLKDLTISTENALTFNPAGGGDPKFIAPPADPVKLYMEQIAETVQDIYRIANLEFVGGVQQSGVALSFHFQEANSSLRTMAEQCETAEKEILSLVHDLMGEKPEGYIAYNNDFNLSDMAQTLATALDAINLKMGNEFDKALKKRIAKQILGNDVEPDTVSAIEDEIDAEGDIYGNRIATQIGVGNNPLPVRAVNTGIDLPVTPPVEQPSSTAITSIENRLGSIDTALQNLKQQPAPQITVEAPQITVEAPVVNVTTPEQQPIHAPVASTKVIELIRDSNGQVTGANITTKEQQTIQPPVASSGLIELIRDSKGQVTGANIKDNQS